MTKLSSESSSTKSEEGEGCVKCPLSAEVTNMGDTKRKNSNPLHLPISELISTSGYRCLHHQSEITFIDSDSDPAPSGVQHQDHIDTNIGFDLSGVHNAQSEERIRLQTRLAEPVERKENGTFKIVNHPKSSHHTHRHGTRQTNASEQSDDIVKFPGPTASSKVPIVEVQVGKLSEECLNIGICDDVPDYPIERVQEIISNLGDKRSNFRIEEVEVGIAQRAGGPEETELCDFDLKIYYPKAAIDKNNKWKYIINDPKNPLQGFAVKICRNKSNTYCSNISLPFTQKTVCLQQYNLRYVYGLDEHLKMTETAIKIPSCCACMILQN